MNIKLSFHIIGNFLKFLGLLMVLPAICSLIYGKHEFWGFIFSAIITSAFGIILELLTKPGHRIEELEKKDGFIIASICWVAAAIFGAVPYLLLGIFDNPVDAFFESMAGFTTTGASVINDIEVLPRGILFWRSFTQWLGGMGIIVLGIAILPRLSVGGMQLMSLEAPGPTTEKITPRIAETAKKLWGIYLILSVLLVMFLFLAGMPVYDSLLQSFSTMSTGGFSPKNFSIAAYNSPIIEVIIMFFMFIAGVSFILHYMLFKGNFKKLYYDSEFRFYFFLIISAILFVSIELWLRVYPDFLSALRYASFQVISIGTTTGYTTDNFDLWPSFSKWILLILMFVGGCAGSTSGAIKNIRIMILLKKCYNEFYRIVYPKAVIPVRIGKAAVAEDVISGISSFFLFYILIFIAGSLILMAGGLPILTSISACAASIGNIGPGFEEVGPMGNYADLSAFIKLVLSLLMLIGRLELFTILILFTPAFWKK